MRVLLDEHYSFRIAEALRTKGYDVVAVVERAELREMPDEELLRCAHAGARALVTENVQDLVPIHASFLSSGEQHSGLVLTSARRFPRTAAGFGPLIAALAALLEGHPGDASLRSDVLWL
jgi:predicted nuclease of predicted toxin-antitoxin system